MSRKDRLQQRLTEQSALYPEIYNVPPIEMPNGDVGMYGKFPVGTHPIDYNQITRVHEMMTAWLSQTQSTKAYLRELLAVVNSTAALQPLAPELRRALTVLDTADHTIDSNSLQVTLNRLHQALGGAGLTYMR